MDVDLALDPELEVAILKSIKWVFCVTSSDCRYGGGHSGKDNGPL